MPFRSRRAKLVLTREVKERLEKISRSRTQAVRRVERAKILLAYAGGTAVSAIARQLDTNRPKVERCIDKALQLGPETALDDLPRPGKPRSITAEARAWLVSLACQKPKDLGYSYELWTTRLLAAHAREHCEEAGHPSLAQLASGTVSKILSAHNIQPHRIRYYLERRDPDFDLKMAQVLHVYKQVELLREQGDPSEQAIAVISYDEKPGIQALGTTTPDLPPVPEKYATFGRDHEYIRYGTVSLLAGIDLLTGRVIGMVADRHRSREFVAFLKILDQSYPDQVTIRVILDNHSAHVSKETREYLRSVPNRFEFVFTPKHGSWLNLIEAFFAKMTKSMLRGIRVTSAQNLKDRILRYLDEINEMPVVFKWKYGLDSLSIV